MKKLIVNAEDFGFNAKVNKGIIHCHVNGILTCASVIVTKEGFQDAIDLARQNPKLDLGIHVDLDKFFKIDHEMGIAKPANGHLPLGEISNEIRKQIEKIMKQGITPKYLSSHHSAHMNKAVFPIVCEFASQYKIRIIQFPERYCNNNGRDKECFKAIIQQYGLRYVPHYIKGWYLNNVDEEYTVAELVTHPGYGELWREYELSYCCNPELKNYLRKSDINLITFTDFCDSLHAIP